MSEDYGPVASLTLSIPEHPPGKFWVYIAWAGKHDHPLYVGKGSGLWLRIGEHLVRSPWGKEVTEFECYAYDSEQDALDAEAQAIHDLMPSENRHRPITRAESEARLAALDRQLAAKHPK